MKRNIFLPEGADFSRSEVDKDAEQLKFEANQKLAKLRESGKKPSVLKAKPKSKKKEKTASYADLLQEYQTRKRNNTHN